MALSELAAVGYGAFTIEAVARRSGVAKSTIYRHWPGKLALIADALDTLNVQTPAGALGAEATAARAGRAAARATWPTPSVTP